jgi:hypothetical protein
MMIQSTIGYRKNWQLYNISKFRVSRQLNSLVNLYQNWAYRIKFYVSKILDKIWISFLASQILSKSANL